GGHVGLGWQAVRDFHEKLPELMDPVRGALSESRTWAATAKAALRRIQKALPASWIRIHIQQQSRNLDQFTHGILRRRMMLHSSPLFPAADRFLAQPTQHLAGFHLGQLDRGTRPAQRSARQCDGRGHEDIASWTYYDIPHNPLSSQVCKACSRV